MRTRYVLYIYMPDEVALPAYQVESSAPFQPFQRGDLINPRTWPEKNRTPFAQSDANIHGLLLRVVRIEHLLYEASQGDGSTLSQHTLRIYTTAVEDTERSRLE